MKKFITLLLAALMVFSLVGCGSKEETKPEGGEDTAENKYDVVFLADLGSIYDGGFNQFSYAGIDQYCSEKGLSCTYLQPAGSSDADRVTIFEQAVNQMKADVVVAVGYLWDAALVQEVPLYPDVKVIFVDADDLYTVDLDYDGTSDGIEKQENLAMITFQEQDCGFMAGYAAVLDGYRKLGFFGGMAVPAVVRFGYGFIEGCEAAAADLGLAEGEVEVKYHYTGTFDASPDLVTYAGNWYTDGTEVIFSCGGTIVNSVIQACYDHEDTRIIGVDTDEYVTKGVDGKPEERIITSAMKSLQNTIYDAVSAAYQGGSAWATYTESGLISLGAAEGAAVIAPYRAENWRTLTEEQYNSVFEKCASVHSTLKTHEDGVNGHPVTDGLKYVTVIDYDN